MTPFGLHEIDALRELTDAWPGTEAVVIGASALRCHMPMGWRISQDLDLSVTMSVEPAGVAVDVVPASPEAMARGYLDWPKTGFRMSLLGMRLAFERCVGFPVGPDLTVKVIPLHVAAVLKIVAYLDRPASRQKDLVDLAHVMHGYVAADSDRRFSDDLIEFDDVAPYLLGRDVGAAVNAAERGRVSGFVARVLDPAQGTPLLARLAIRGPLAWRDPDAVLQRLVAFQRGLL